MNDHLLKGWWPGLVTGKLSDFTGLIVLPLLLQAVWERVQARRGLPWGPSARVAVVWCALIGGAFAAMQLWTPAAEAYRWAMGLAQWPFWAVVELLGNGWLPAPRPVAHVADPTDVVALVVLPLVVWLTLRRRRRAMA